MLGEISDKHRDLVNFAIAICPPLDLAHTVRALSEGVNIVYERYYLRQLQKQSKQWIRGRKIRSLYEYDQLITATEWGFRDAEEYYQTCSSLYFLPRIQCPCYVLLSADDPIIDYSIIKMSVGNPMIKVWVSPHGGHMGFFSRDLGEHGRFWLDYTLLNWIAAN